MENIFSIYNKIYTVIIIFILPNYHANLKHIKCIKITLIGIFWKSYSVLICFLNRNSEDTSQRVYFHFVLIFCLFASYFVFSGFLEDNSSQSSSHCRKSIETFLTVTADCLLILSEITCTQNKTF